ncbi:DUF6519 domain-containing protein [Tropicimonas sp. IMCC34043]|uniref:DUF6519 domain-containing protein n=1 Tax=Tropicimonas sp. IMCC34043 TaxID=2248760 RepID=UPI000E259645|nr:DUF6519 domain-containing protein [Tropicimonas sp. IMCC34043]
MSGDYSRMTHDALKRYSALLLQQGRVLLDSDFNELVDILRERVDKLSLDAMGNPGIPYLTNPDAFLITLAGGPTDLVVTPGRIYVDGLMAEVFEGESFSYLGQPFLPDPPPLPAGDAAVYLTVWEEELTWVEAPSLLDPALGGVDTTTRRRTIVQLFAEEVEAAQCGIDVGPPPSAGRLTTRAVAPPAPDDPCILPPVSGYRGLENRLYRVEVHDGGPLGTARFKWSRDNGSIQVPVERLAAAGPQSLLGVPRIGRDPVMRFFPGDWVTVTDDHREWMDEPGEMARVVDIDEADGTITLDRDITGLGRPFGADAAALALRHTRLQKWDQSAATDPTIDGDGLIATAAGPIALDGAGIELSFSTDPAGGAFRRGDYWLFWARTATASIEELTDAAPRGIVRHHVQLAAAVGLGGANAVLTDCRPGQPEAGESCCTMVVHPGESIQAAIDALPPQGGCVCLKAGVHPVPGTIDLNRANVHLHGESPGAILQGAAPLLSLGTAASGIRIEMVEFVGRVSDVAGGAILIAGGAEDLGITDCRFSPFPGTFGGIAMLLTRVDYARISGNTIIDTDFGVVFNGLCTFPVIEDNTMLFGIDGDTVGAATGIWIAGTSSACRIEDNVIFGAFQGIVINDAPFEAPYSDAASSSVSDNIILVGTLQREGTDAEIGIDAAADFTLVTGNNVFLLGARGIAIRATGSGSIVSHNMIGSAGREQSAGIGIQIGHAGEEDTKLVANGNVVSENQIAGELSGIAAFGASATVVSGNSILCRPASATIGIIAVEAPLLRVERNRIATADVGILGSDGRNTLIEGNDMIGCRLGAAVISDLRASLRNNRVGAATLGGLFGAQLLGRTEFSGNQIVGAGSGLPLAIGIGALLVVGEWHVASNEVTDTGIDEGGEFGGPRAFGIFGLLVLQARIESNLVTYSDVFGLDPAREDRALWLLGIVEYSVNFGEFEFVFGYPAQILGNKFAGAGASALVELGAFDLTDTLSIRYEDVMFSNNHCLHLSGAGDKSSATVVLTGRRASVGGNQVKATSPGFPSFDFNGMTGPFFGNTCSGPALNYTPFTPSSDGIHNLVQ